MRVIDEDVDQREIEFYGGPIDGFRRQFVASSLPVAYTTIEQDGRARYVLTACADGSLRYVFAPMIETFTL